MDVKEALIDVLKKEGHIHDTELKGLSGHSQEYEDGFLKGIQHVTENVIPSFFAAWDRGDHDNIASREEISDADRDRE